MGPDVERAENVHETAQIFMRARSGPSPRGRHRTIVRGEAGGVCRDRLQARVGTCDQGQGHGCNGEGQAGEVKLVTEGGEGSSSIPTENRRRRVGHEFVDDWMLGRLEG